MGIHVYLSKVEMSVLINVLQNQMGFRVPMTYTKEDLNDVLKKLQGRNSIIEFKALGKFLKQPTEW